MGRVVIGALYFYRNMAAALIRTEQRKGVFTLTITKKQDGTALTIAPEGRLDTNTAPQLEAELKSSLSGVTELTLDFEKLVYMSSAGLRTVLFAQKQMNRQGSMKVCHVNATIMEVFKLTGFSNILTIV